MVGVFQAQIQAECDQNLQKRCRSFAAISESKKSKDNFPGISLLAELLEFLLAYAVGGGGLGVDY
jgi:hypothetical protein